jgi:hypothetical protein
VDTSLRHGGEARRNEIGQGATLNHSSIGSLSHWKSV